MTDIVKRLRDGPDGLGHLCDDSLEAADEIERLRRACTSMRDDCARAGNAVVEADMEIEILRNALIEVQKDRELWIRRADKTWHEQAVREEIRAAIEALPLPQPVYLHHDALNAVYPIKFMEDLRTAAARVAARAPEVEAALDAEIEAMRRRRGISDGGVREGWNRTTSGAIGQP